MPNEFKVRNGLVVEGGSTIITGSLIVTGGITGSLSGSGGGGSPAFPFTGSAGITGSLNVVGNTTITGSATNALSLRGSGATTATNTMRVENSAGTPIMIIRDDLTVLGQSFMVPISSMTQFPIISSSLGVFAMGNTTTEAVSTNSIALGAGCKSRGAYSIAVGFESKAYGLSSVSMGNNNEASGSYSTAFGDTNTARGIYSFSVGGGNRSSGSYSVTMGGGNVADGLRSIGIGEGNVTPGTRAMALGWVNTVLGSQDVVVGGNNWANGGLATLLGTYLSSSTSQQVVTGQYNTASSAATFIIGNGVNAGARRNIVEVVGSAFNVTGSFTVTTGSAVELQVLSTGVRIGNIITDIHNVTGSLRINGDVGIGTSSPAERLHIVASGSGTDVPLYIAGTGTKGGTGYLDFLKVENTGGVSNPKKFFRINNSNGAWEVVNDAYNSVIMALDDTGNIQIAGTLTQNSDRSLKTNIQTIPNALEKTLQLRGVEYDRISTGKHEIGLIAQEVEQVFPELVSETNGIKSVAYSNIVSILIESIKELKQEIDILREQINKK